MKQIKNLSLRLLLSVLLLSFFSACKDDNPTNPTASFTYQVDSENPLLVSFEASTTGAVFLAWDFGDGGTSTVTTPTHTYTDGGDYVVTLTVTGEGCSTPARTQDTITLVVPKFEPVTVENGDFELPGDVKHQNWSEVPGWNSDTQASDSGVESDGTNWSAFIKNTDPSVYNLTDHVIAAGEELKVNMDVWDIWNGPKFTVTLFYDSGDGTRNVVATQTFDIVAGQTNAIEMTATATDASVGGKLGIEISNESGDGGDGWTGFDNVQLFTK